MRRRMEETRTYSRLAAGVPPASRILVALLPSGLEHWVLPKKGKLRIGSAPESDVFLGDHSVAASHATLDLDDTPLLRNDSGAETRVEGLGLQQGEAAELQLGATFDLGRISLMVQRRGHLPVDDASDPPAMTPPTPPMLRFQRLDGRMAAIGGALARIYELLRQIAPGNVPVIVSGETGVGKEVVAELIHRTSARAAGPFVVVHCASLSPALFESELFGHERGAFTGAATDKKGIAETAHGGTLFLDEIGDVPPELQVKLLRFLETRAVTRVGSTTSRALDLRFVSATHRDLEAEVRSGRFREDLYYRLACLTIYVPPLRERPDELLELAREMLSCADRPLQLSARAETALLGHPFPGNVRELQMSIARASAVARTDTVEPEDLGLAAPANPTLVPTGHAPWEADLRAALLATAGNQTAAARRLGISRRTLVTRLQTLREKER